jgi:hypothetical protein
MEAATKTRAQVVEAAHIQKLQIFRLRQEIASTTSWAPRAATAVQAPMDKIHILMARAVLPHRYAQKAVPAAIARWAIRAEQEAQQVAV